MKRIICPIDFSEAANNAVEFSANLAAGFKGELTLLHIVPKMALQDVSNKNSDLLSTIVEREKEADAKLQTYCSMVEEQYQVTCKTKIKTYNAGLEKALAIEMDEEDYELIVMGTSGADDFNQLFFGTHTYHVIRKTTIPLLLIPKGCSFEGLRRVVYASDYNHEDVQTLEKILRITNVFNSTIDFLHVSSHDTPKSEEIFQLFKDLYQDRLALSEDKITFQRVVDKDVARAIDQYMEASKSDLLVLQAEHRNLVQRLFHESVTKKLSLVAGYPVLVNPA